MAFEVFVSGRQDARALRAGEASINVSGRLTFTRGELVAAQIDRDAVLVVDRATLRVAVRAPRDNDREFGDVTVPVRWAKRGKTASVSVAAAARHMGLALDKVCGRWPVMHKDDLLIVGPLKATAATPAKKRAR